MTNTYKCFGCDNEYDMTGNEGILEMGWFDSWFLCPRCCDKLLMRKGSL